MRGHVKAERKALEATYEDVCTISRMSPVTGLNGITKMEPAPVYTDVMCALSARGDSSKQTEAQHHLEYDMLLFTSLETVLKAGDEVTVKRFGRVNSDSPYILSFEVIGLPLMYASHNQAKLKAVDLA